MIFSAPFLNVSCNTIYKITTKINTNYSQFLIEGNKYQPFIIFSMYTNGQKLFSCTQPRPSSGTIPCIEGIRVLSMAWIVCFHNYLIYKKIPLRESVKSVEVKLNFLFPSNVKNYYLSIEI